MPTQRMPAWDWIAKRALAKMSTMTWGPTMPLSQHLIVIALGIAVVTVAALPLFIAAVVMLVPLRLARKRSFVLVSGALRPSRPEEMVR